MDVMHTLEYVLVIIGLLGMFILAQYFDPKPVSLIDHTGYYDKTFVLEGKAVNISQTPKTIRGTLQTTCPIDFVMITDPNTTITGNRFIGTIDKGKSPKPDDDIFLIEEIK